MQKRYIASLLITLAAGALLLANDRSHAIDSLHNEQGDHHDNGSHVQIALTDMLHHAADHLALATPEEHSFGSAHGWMTGWELHWMDFHRADHVVRIYHATHEHHPHVRYVAIVDPEHDHFGGWTPVH